MHRLRGTIWAERALVVLFLASLAGTLNLIVSVHRKAVVKTAVTDPSAPAIEAVPVVSSVKTTPAREPEHKVSPPPVVVSTPKVPAVGSHAAS